MVNEALLAGLPVICSDRVGAACLVEPGVTGSIFPAGDTVALARAIGYWIGRLPADRTSGNRKSLMRTGAPSEATRLADFITGMLEQ